MISMLKLLSKLLDGFSGDGVVVLVRADELDVDLCITQQSRRSTPNFLAKSFNMDNDILQVEKLKADKRITPRLIRAKQA
ncbi:hypothetical protein LP414_08595 [Polaromonas sp. P1(28)-13]|nr:hypothetical protein LP414_08595 [Polaromonas sp. P1(28)-13]